MMSFSVRKVEVNMIEKVLIIILRVSGLLLITAFIFLFVPYEIMAQIHKQIGLGHFPQIPILAYLARSVSLFYAIHGAIILFISFDINKYSQILKLLCYLGILFGICLFFIDLNAPMPSYWTYGEGPLAVILSLIILVLISKIKKDK